MSHLIPICISSLLVCLACGVFYEENVRAASWATITPANVILPTYFYLLFRYFKWTDWRSALIFITLNILLVAAIGHKNFYDTTAHFFANKITTTTEKNISSVTPDTQKNELQNDKMKYATYLGSHLQRSGFLFFDHLRFHALRGTISEEKAYAYGPYIKIFRQGFWVWYNWFAQLLQLWLISAFVFLLSEGKGEDKKSHSH